MEEMIFWLLGDGVLENDLGDGKETNCTETKGVNHTLPNITYHCFFVSLSICLDPHGHL
jgi:hypothetical protein